MHHVRGWALALGMMVSAPALTLTMTVAIEPLTDTANQAFVTDYLPLARYLSPAVGQPVNATLSRELAREMVRTALATTCGEPMMMS